VREGRGENGDVGRGGGVYYRPPKLKRKLSKIT